jgi:hypothetical protein
MQCCDGECAGCVACRTEALPLPQELQTVVAYHALCDEDQRWNPEELKKALRISEEPSRFTPRHVQVFRIALEYGRLLALVDNLGLHLRILVSNCYGKSHAEAKKAETACMAKVNLRSRCEDAYFRWLDAHAWYNPNILRCADTQVFFGQNVDFPNFNTKRKRGEPKYLTPGCAPYFATLVHSLRAIPRLHDVFVSSLTLYNTAQHRRVMEKCIDRLENTTLPWAERMLETASEHEATCCATSRTEQRNAVPPALGVVL